MPGQCVVCSDGAVLCGNPRPTCGSDAAVASQPDSPTFDEILVDVADGKLRVRSNATIDFGTPVTIRIYYDDENRLVVSFLPQPAIPVEPASGGPQ
jgi:hypothetical protein